jgi:adenine-specific DNA-methyltransferase
MVQLPDKHELLSHEFKNIADVGKERIRRAGKKIMEGWQIKRAKEQPKQGDLLDLSSTIHDAPAPPDIGFRVLKIDSSNRADIYRHPAKLSQEELSLQVDHLKSDRMDEDFLFQVLLDWGVDLDLPITEETLVGKRVFFVDGNALAACFALGVDDNLIRELAKREPLRAVFRDTGFASDAAKINAEQLFKALSPHTDLKTL